MAYQIVWTEKANVERQHILQFWIDNNKSSTFSLKLNRLFIATIRDIAKGPILVEKLNLKMFVLKLFVNT